MTTALKLGTPTFWCHQTLSFKKPLDCPLEEVKRPLKRLLDSLHKAYSMGTLYVIEPCEKEGWHIHAYFIFYGFMPFSGDRERNRQLFGRHVFRLWNRVNGGSLCRIANKTTVHDNLDPTYFIKHLVALPRWKPKKRDSANWWGVRNRKLLKQNEAPLDAILLEGTQAKVKCNEVNAREKSRCDSGDERNWKPDPLFECPPVIRHKSTRKASLNNQPRLGGMHGSDFVKLLLAG